MLVAGAFAVVTVVRSHGYERERIGVVAAACVLLALALAAGWTSLVPWPLVLLGGAYAWSIGRGEVDQWAPVFAAGVLAVAELSYWSLELRGRVADAERLNERRAGLIVALAIGTVACGGVVLAATSLRIGEGVAVDLVGVAAAVGALAVVASLARANR
ncbi:MAG: hypothetical protein ACYDA3_00720 [Gaiellaceae bacterium]